MSTDSKHTKHLKSKVILTLTVLAASGILGMAAFSGLSALYAPPTAKVRLEPFLEVETITLQPQPFTMHLQGWGEAKSISMAPISSKVPGEVVEVHPQLKMGNVIQEGETLLRIDDTDLRILQGQAQAQLNQAETTIARMEAQFGLDSKRLVTIQRSMELARSEFNKDKALLAERNVGSESMVNASELNYNKARDAYDQVKNALELFPTVLQEAESMQHAAQLQLDKVDLDLSRTLVKAPYTGRIKLVQVELGQTVGPGIPLLVLADDSALEISVPLDSVEAREWLSFGENTVQEGAAWFADLEPMPCNVYWTEDKQREPWKGVLSRVERYDQMTRTMAVSVRVQSEDAVSGDGLPLVDGMFCEVEIEGQTIENAYIVPRWAVTYDHEIFIADNTDIPEEYRLKRVSVEVLGVYGDNMAIANTLSPGVHVVTTKLHDPLHNSLLKLVNDVQDTHASTGKDATG